MRGVAVRRAYFQMHTSNSDCRTLPSFVGCSILPVVSAMWLVALLQKYRAGARLPLIERPR